MANNCWNWVTLEGDPVALKSLVGKFGDYDKANYFVEFGNYVLGLGEIGDKSWMEDDKVYYYEYGTKWWDFDIDDSGESITITGDSAWSPPVKLIEQICIKYKLTGTMEYEEGGLDFAGIVEFNESGIISHDEMSFHEYRYKDDVSSWIDNLMYNHEDDSAEDLETIHTDHPYAKKEHRIELINAVKERQKTQAADQ